MSGADLHVERWGEDGHQVLLVHGSVMGGAASWAEQRPLAERWRLVVLDRRGYYPNPPVAREDVEVDAEDVAELLGHGGEGMHLVGSSYGGVVALLAAAKRPEAVRSLTVIEPPAVAVAMEDPDVFRFAADVQKYWSEGPREPEAFLRGFLERVGSTAVLPSPLLPPLDQNAHLLMNERDPAEARIPLSVLRRANFPKLVVSGAHSPVFDRICDALQSGLWAERAVIAGAGHSVQRTGADFNVRLEKFLIDAGRRTRSAALRHVPRRVVGIPRRSAARVRRLRSPARRARPRTSHAGRSRRR
jgi:pimeloyl-ACP methyl ester carboxylesterase